jgi:hypothetical protein
VSVAPSSEPLCLGQVGERFANRKLIPRRADERFRKMVHDRPSRKKKAPGKAVSQGGRGQQPYPGAIGLSTSLTFAQKRRSIAARVRRVSEACRRHPCQRVRFVVRRKALVASPVQTHHMDPSCISRAVETGFRGRDRTFIGVVRRENMGIAKPGQGRFFRLFCRHFTLFLALSGISRFPLNHRGWLVPACRGRTSRRRRHSASARRR